MALFNIKRGDSMPPVVIALRVSGVDPALYWDVTDDKAPGDNSTTDHTGGTPPGDYTVKFIMTDLNTGKIVGPSGNVSQGFTGFGTIYQAQVGFADAPTNHVPIFKTLVRYDWQSPDVGFVPSSTTNGSLYGGDTQKAGVYNAEFEVIYKKTTSAGVQLHKRTFPVTPGDTLIINVLADSNDKLVGESI